MVGTDRTDRAIKTTVRINHELANELTAIIGYVELLENTALTPIQRSHLAEISLASSRALGYLPGGDNPMDLALDDGQLHIEFGNAGTRQAVDRNNLLDGILTLCHECQQMLGRRMDFEIDAGQSGAKLSPCASCGRELTVGQGIVIVTDQESPIPRDSLPHLFTPGFSTTTTRDLNERRQGFTAAAARIHDQGCHIGVSSDQSGTRFRIYLP
jgi:signal transduction histidine kinase